ncbi:MAG: hypothetical protein NVS3B25_11790 [Hymenobacter sp.]
MKNVLLPIAARGGRLGSALLLGAALTLFSAGPARAQDAPTPVQEAPHWAGVNKISDFHYTVWGCNPAAVKGSVRLMDANGNILYQQNYSGVSFGRTFNIGQLPDGQYEFVVTVGKEPHRFPLSVQSLPERSDQPLRIAQISPELSPATQRMASTRATRRHADRSKGLRTNNS